MAKFKFVSDSKKKKSSIKKKRNYGLAEKRRVLLKSTLLMEILEYLFKDISVQVFKILFFLISNPQSQIEKLGIKLNKKKSQHTIGN